MDILVQWQEFRDDQILKVGRGLVGFWSVEHSAYELLVGKADSTLAWQQSGGAIPYDIGSRQGFQAVVIHRAKQEPANQKRRSARVHRQTF